MYYCGVHPKSNTWFTRRYSTNKRTVPLLCISLLISCYMFRVNCHHQGADTSLIWMYLGVKFWIMISFLKYIAALAFKSIFCGALIMMDDSCLLSDYHFYSFSSLMMAVQPKHVAAN